LSIKLNYKKLKKDKREKNQDSKKRKLTESSSVEQIDVEQEVKTTPQAIENNTWKKKTSIGSHKRRRNGSIF